MAFKVGDRVEYVGRHAGFHEKRHMGKKGIVTGFGGANPNVKFDNGTSASGIYPDNLELVTPATWAPVEGKYGKTRDGRKVGPMVSIGGVWPFIGKVGGNSSAYFIADGTYPYLPENDLVAEWVEPVADPSTTTSTVRLVPTIVDGDYGCVSVRATGETGPKVGILIGGLWRTHAVLDADDLTAAIATLTTVRDALREVA